MTKDVRGHHIDTHERYQQWLEKLLALTAVGGREEGTDDAAQKLHREKAAHLRFEIKKETKQRVNRTKPTKQSEKKNYIFCPRSQRLSSGADSRSAKECRISKRWQWKQH